MTLQEVLTILNLNPLFKDSTDNFKITAINQALNEFQVSEVLYDTDAPKFNLRIEKYENQSHKELQKILETDYTEEEILALFKYSLIDLTLEKAFDAVIKDYTSGFIEEITLRMNSEASYVITTPIVITPPTTRNTPDLSKDSDKFTIKINATFKVYIPKEEQQAFGLGAGVTFNVWDGTLSSDLSLGYSITYLIF